MAKETQSEVQIDKFPTLVYKGEGPHSRAGGTYDFVAVADEEALKVKLRDGWFATLPEAIEASDNQTPANATPQKPASRGVRQ